MQMISNRLDTSVGEGMLFFGGPPLANHARNNLPQMRGDRIRREQITVLIEVRAPGIDHSGSHHLKRVVVGMKSPDPTGNHRPLRTGGTGPTNVGTLRQSNSAIKPTVRTPVKIIQYIIRRCLKTIEHHNGWSVGNIVAVGIGDKRQFRGIGQPYTAVSYCNPAQITSAAPKHFPPIKSTVVVDIFENQNAIRSSILPPLGVRIILDNPQPAAIVKVKGDRAAQIGFTSEQGYLETVWNDNAFEGLLRSQRYITRILCIDDTRR